MKKNIIRECIRRAYEKHNNEHPSWNKKSVHYSFIVLDNKIIEMGFNRPDQHPPDHYGYPWYAYLHSELDAWRKARHFINEKNFEIVNIRLLKTESASLANAAPCANCIAFLADRGCVKFYFSTDSGHIAKIIP